MRLGTIVSQPPGDVDSLDDSDEEQVHLPLHLMHELHTSDCDNQLRDTGWRSLWQHACL
jgi:hypothetical protein